MITKQRMKVNGNKVRPKVHYWTLGHFYLFLRDYNEFK